MRWLLLCLAAGCSEPQPHYRPRPDGPGAGLPGTGTPTGTPAGTPAGTTTGETQTTTFDCTSRPSGPFTVNQIPILTEEDFTFDADGRLIYQDFTAIMGTEGPGTTTVLATGAPGDPAGMDAVADGKLLIAGPDTGTLRRFDLNTGSGETLLSGLSFPNGVLGDRDGFAYVSELTAGRVRRLDPVTGDVTPVASGLDAANGLALSPDEQTLYIAAGATVEAVQRDPVTGAWDPGSRWTLWAGPPGTLVYTLDTDVCGWVYFVDYASGALRRISPNGVTVEPIAQLTGGWAWSGMNFGNGAGIWPRDTLYITNRSTIAVIPIGIPGSPGPNLPPTP